MSLLEARTAPGAPRRFALIAAAAALALGLASCQSTPPFAGTEQRDRLVETIQRSLEEDLLDVWYPRVVDTVHGGFLSRFDDDWEPTGQQDKFIVTQARHVWTLARAAEFLPQRRQTYLAAAAQGVDFLRDHMWDDDGGGFQSLVTREGGVRSGTSEFTDGKTAYGNAFALYALAAYADVSGDTAALDFARRSFRWIDKHMHDPGYGGYFQFVDNEGTPLQEGLGDTPPKDQNSSIHLLEAFTELYQIWPDSVLRARLDEMLVLVRDTMTTDTRYLRLYFEQDWTPVSHRDSSETFIRENLGLDHVSYGHDVETAYLILEAAHALEIDPVPTLSVGKRMVDHALAHGWDDENGGFFDGGYYFTPDGPPEVVIESKAWWAQAEALNTMLLMASLNPDDDQKYIERFEAMWTYIDTYLIDHERGGWYVHGIDRDPDAPDADKAGIWKGMYHEGRALMNVIRSLSVGSAQFIDHFEDEVLHGWTHNTGDGAATMEMIPHDGYVSVVVDATQDRDNIWWALIKRDVSAAIDLQRLNEPQHEIRIEARIRTSHAPRRVNLHLNTQRTVDFHSHLMEFDIPDTSGWHTISMTTRDFDARHGDTVNGQLALMDWGPETYRVDIDYFRVDVVDTTRIGPDSGEQVPYHPPIPRLDTFKHHVRVAEDAMIDLHNPEATLETAYPTRADGGETPILTVDSVRHVILRWDLDALGDRLVPRAGVLTLITHSVQRAESEIEEFGQVRVAEILGGAPDWNDETVSLNRFTRGRPLDEVVNTQMIIDVEVAEGRGGTTFITISRPVLQRMIDGRTLGLLLRPLGPITASFYASEGQEGTRAPALHFDAVRHSFDQHLPDPPHAQ